MEFPTLPSPADVARHFAGALGAARCASEPYRHWILHDVLPESACVGILSLPIAPPSVGHHDGTRASFNAQRTFFNVERNARYAPCAMLANALQRPKVARRFAETCGVEVRGSFLRIEYIQDLDGAWLEPHCDIPEKLFSMVIYLCTGPDAKDWGTDIYDAERRWAGRSSAEFDSAVIFIPGANTWHGFERRPIAGIRRLMEVNYVRADWRDREQLCFPDRPITDG